jgi:hypothetical protein
MDYSIRNINRDPHSASSFGMHNNKHKYKA